jgi:uncharacterized protein YigE (DUF2233 family)
VKKSRGDAVVKKHKTYTNLSFFLALFFCCNYALAAKAKRLNEQGVEFDIFTIPKSEQHKIRFFWQHKQQSIGTLKKLKEHINSRGEHLVFATNGGIFSTNRSPKGLFVQAGKEINALNTQSGFGNFFLQPNGVLNIDNRGSEIVKTSAWKADRKPLYAIQSGPMLVIDGKIHPAFKQRSDSLRIRNGVGIDADGNLHFVISNQLTNLYQFADFFKTRLHCQQALYLDGTISEMYIKDFRQETLAKEFVTMIGLVE